MSTPTPSHPSQPASASKKPLGHVTTPSNFGASSPAPCSVPSPATMRKDQAGKTPTNHGATGSSQGSKTLSSTPMLPNLSQQGSTGSPAGNVLSFGTPMGLGLGVDGATPGQLNMPTPSMLVSLPMNPTLSELGLTMSGGSTGGHKRSEDEDRRARMHRILKSIGKPKGKLSEEGIARVSRRVGFANDIDAEKLSKEEMEKRVGNRAISIAGNTIVIDVDLLAHVPQKVTVTHSKSSKALEEEASAAAAVLLQDLCVPDGVTLRAKLDAFTINLERLAQIDRLSSDDINCFEAIAGVYTSLRRIYEQELQVASDSDVMCRRSGKPLMHARGQLGFSLGYWQNGRQLIRREQPEHDAATKGSAISSEDAICDEDDIFTITIQPEASPAALYPSLRVSDTWLPNPLVLPAIGTVDGIPWQEPPPTLVPPTSTLTDADAIDLDSGPRQPDLRFVARLDPPVVVPLHIANSIFAAFGLPAPQIFIAHYYIDLLLHPYPTSVHDMATNDVHLMASKVVLNMAGDLETEVMHHYKFEGFKGDLGYKIGSLPFSHPRQLVEILPILRQWACLGCLLKGAIGGSTTAPVMSCEAGVATAPASDLHSLRPSSLQDLLTPPETPSQHATEAVPIDMSLLTSPVPSISVSFPAGPDKAFRSMSVLVLPNAAIMVTESDDSPMAHLTANEDTRSKRAADALDVCGDLEVWIEWLRSL